MTNFLQAYTDKQGWNKERFRVFTQERLSVVRDVFGEEDQSFARTYFEADWQDLFAGEHVPDTVTALDYNSLEPGKRLEIDQLVELGSENAAAFYEQAGKKPSLARRTWRFIKKG